MRIKKENQLGLMFVNGSHFVEELFTNIIQPDTSSGSFSTVQDRAGHLNRLKQIFIESNNRYYLITKTVLEMAEKIKLPIPFDSRILSKTPKIKRTLLIDEKEFFRYTFIDDDIHCIHVTFDWEKSFCDYDTFRLNTITGAVITNNEARIKESADRFLKIITFMDLSDIEEIVLAPNQKVGTKKSNPIKNDTSTKITVVNSNWNKYVIRLEGFTVGAETGGFFRFQPYGPKNELRKLIWILPFEKSGYIRTPKSNKE